MNKPPLAPRTLSDTIFTEAENEPTEKDKSPFPRPHNTVTDADFFALSTPDLDIREWFGPSLLLIILSPLCTSILSWYQLALLAVGRLCLPPIIRQRYPHFMRTDVLEELRIRAGGALSLCGSITAFILQVRLSFFCKRLELIVLRHMTQGLASLSSFTRDSTADPFFASFVRFCTLRWH
jgi:hypothetical protein